MTQAQSKTGATTNYAYTYAYNSRDLLTSVSTGTPNTYVYDHDGRRTQETANGTVTKFIWDQLSAFGDVLLEQNLSGNTPYVNGGSQLLSQKKGDGVDQRFIATRFGTTEADLSRWIARNNN